MAVTSRKKKTNSSSAISTSIDDVAGETGISGTFTKREAVALRTLVAFIENRASFQADAVKDVVDIANRFSEEMGWDD